MSEKKRRPSRSASLSNIMSQPGEEGGEFQAQYEPREVLGRWVELRSYYLARVKRLRVINFQAEASSQSGPLLASYSGHLVRSPPHN